MFALALGAGLATKEFWIPSMGRSLICNSHVASSDAILVENLDASYALFERGAALQRAGFARRILVSTPISSNDPIATTDVTNRVTELMARSARMHHWQIIPIAETEPISLNAAKLLRDFLTKEHLSSVIVVTTAFRSRRSALILQTILNPVAIQVYCAPVFGELTPDTWATSWHGVQNVTEQFIKLQFYRFYVLPLSGGR